MRRNRAACPLLSEMPEPVTAATVALKARHISGADQSTSGSFANGIYPGTDVDPIVESIGELDTCALDVAPLSIR